MAKTLENATFEERFEIKITRLNSDGKIHHMTRDNGGFGFTKSEVEVIARCKLDKDAKVKGYTVVRMKDSIITKIG